ncbi:MAG: hypothetical protein LBL73_07310 [Synergistaceae bacterium]|jgi:hypothetical protein|nr:hypothetical protein [Synergistaceae bacterium]
MAAISGEFEEDGHGLLRTARRLAISLTLVCVAFLIADLGLYFGGVGFESPGRFAAGLAVGWACSAMKVCMMTRSFFRMMRLGGRSATTGFVIGMASRYAVTAAAALPVLFFTRVFGPVGFLGGLLSMPIGGYLANSPDNSRRW